jgi:hypothetical protein
LFVHDSRSDAEAFGAPYREEGWGVLAAAADSSQTIEMIAEERPSAAVFCLDGPKALDACSLAEAVLYDQRGIRPLMIFVGGNEQDRAAAQSMVPIGVFVEADELPAVLSNLGAWIS